MSLMMKCEEIINQLLNQTNKPSTLEIIEIIINIVVALLTVGALIAAIIANKQNKEEINEVKKATKKSLQMHEQSKNLQLMEMRLQLLYEIENSKSPRYYIDISPKKENGTIGDISINKLKLLYNEDPTIIKAFTNLKEYYNKSNYLINNLIHFYRLGRTPDGEGGFCNPVWERIKKYEDLRGLPNYLETTENEYKEFCDNHTYSELCPVDGQNVEYNYYNIQQELNNAVKSFDTTKDILLKQMRIFIDESIKPIDS